MEFEECAKQPVFTQWVTFYLRLLFCDNQLCIQNYQINSCCNFNFVIGELFCNSLTNPFDTVNAPVHL